jgi:hypothetical protein
MRHGPFDNKDHQNTQYDVRNKPKFNIPLMFRPEFVRMKLDIKTQSEIA